MSLTKKQRRALRQESVLTPDNELSNEFRVKDHIRPLTNNQRVAQQSWHDGQNIIMYGVAGTGKTFIALMFALREMMQENSRYKCINIIRSVVPTRDIGFLPGNAKEKLAAYEEPYVTICKKLFERSDAYNILKMKGVIQFTSTSFLRGDTFDDTLVIVDEYQNMSDAEINTVVTRMGDNSRIIFCGDHRQTDLHGKYDTSGYSTFMNIAKDIPSFDLIEFGIDDIVRSDFVKEYLIAREKYFRG